MKYIFISLLMACSLILMGGIIACNPEDTSPMPETPCRPENNDNMKIRVKIGETIFTATLLDNSTGMGFRDMLPLTIRMSELNKNEKYYNFSGSLPTAASYPGTIRSGDLMLYDSNCLVLFYKTFITSYSYTRIGSIDNPDGLETAIGTGDVTITFEAVSSSL